MLYLLLLSFLTIAEAKKPQSVPINPNPQSNLYLRDTPDKDPTDYIGRFIFSDPAKQVPNESLARKTECSQYITYRTVSGGNVEYDEIMNASAALSAGLKFPGMNPNIKAGADGGFGVRASYTMTSKIIGDISNPEAFDACCFERPGNCSEYFVSEFVEGSGKLWRAHSNFVGLKMTGKIKKYLPTDVEAHGEFVWASTRDFAEPVYFAFKTTYVPSLCERLIDQSIKIPDGLYISGVSDFQSTEKTAKQDAVTNAQQFLVSILVNDMSSSSSSSSVSTYDQTSTQSAQAFSQSSSATIKNLKIDRFCPVEKVGSESSYKAKVILLITNEDLEKIKSEINQ